MQMMPRLPVPIAFLRHLPLLIARLRLLIELLPLPSARNQPLLPPRKQRRSQIASRSKDCVNSDNMILPSGFSEHAYFEIVL